MAYNTGNAIGSTSPKDLSDNARNFDLLVLGPLLSYPDRRGVNRLSWAGIEASFSAAQTQRAADFNAAQAQRTADFNAAQNQRASDYAASEASRGYENPVPYAAGIALTRVTQLVQYNSELYKAKVGTLPWTTTGVWATDSAKLVSVGDASVREDLSKKTGSAMIGHVPTYPGGFFRTVADALSDAPTSKDMGAVGDGNLRPVSDWHTFGATQYRGYADLAAVQADYPHVTSGTQPLDWAALQQGFSGKQGFNILDGNYRIDGCTLKYSAKADLSGRGKQVSGRGRRRTIISNLTTNHPLIDFGDVSGNFDSLDCCLFSLSVQGNILSIAGIRILGDDDQGLSQASRAVSIDDVRVSNVGAGPGLLVSAWVPNIGYLEMEGNYRGVQIGQHVYAGRFSKFYNISAVNEAIFIADTVTSSKSCQIVFENPVLQGCGAGGQAVYLGGAAGVAIKNAYTENLNPAATAAIRVGANNRNSRIEDFFYTRGTGPTVVDIVDTASPSLIVDGIDGRGDVRSFVKITGGNVGTRISNLEHPTGNRSQGWIDDQSTNKRTTYINPKDATESRLTPMAFWASTAEPALKWCNRSNGAIQGFIQNGRIYMGADDTSSNLQAGGTTISALSGSSGSYATLRSAGLRFDVSNCKVIYRAASTPEGVETADPGSICMVQTGASAGLWKKDSGTGNTGWIKL